MTTREVPRIANGQVYRPTQIITETLGSFIDALGGEDEFRKRLRHYETLPGRALDIALRHSRLESILSLVGEMFVILSLHAGIAGYVIEALREKQGPPSYPWIPIFAPALVALCIHVALQVYWTKDWFSRNLRAAFVARSKADALRSGIEYYYSFAPQLATPVLFFYPLAAYLTLLWIEAPFWVLCFEIPAGIFTGWMAKSLYYTRLLHTDFREWFSVFALDLDEEEAAALRDARKGRGLHRRLWEWLERRGETDASHFEIFTLAQCGAGLIDSALVLIELVLLKSYAARLSVAVPLCLGLFIVGYSHFRRYAFLNKSRTIEASIPPENIEKSALAEQYRTPDELPTGGLDDTSRILRRAMP